MEVANFTRMAARVSIFFSIAIHTRIFSQYYFTCDTILIMAGLQTDFSVTSRLLPQAHSKTENEVSSTKDPYTAPLPGWQYMLPNDQGAIPPKRTNHMSWQSVVPNTTLPIFSSGSYVSSNSVNLQKPSPELCRLYQAATMATHYSGMMSGAGTVPLHHADEQYCQPSSSRTEPSSNSCSPLPPNDYQNGTYTKLLIHTIIIAVYMCMDRYVYM